MLNIIQRRKIWFIVSTVLVLLSIIFFVLFRLNLGIDFAGGTIMEVKISEQVAPQELESEVENPLEELQTVETQKLSEGEYLIKTRHLNQEQHETIKEHLSQVYPNYEESRFENVGPSVGRDLQNNAVWSVIVAAVGIILYIWWAFRRLPSEVSSFQFGVAAIIALLHDIMIVVGTFALLGYFFPSVMVDSYFIVALLTIMGFSVHDTIVVFDRLRENLLEEGGQHFEKVANDSINQTIVRSINMTLTLLIVLGAMYFLGGGGVGNFLLALIIGVVIGTYSSIFVATPVVVWWQSR